MQEKSQRNYGRYPDLHTGADHQGCVIRLKSGFQCVSEHKRRAVAIKRPNGSSQIQWIGIDGYLRTRECFDHRRAERFVQRIDCVLRIAEWIEDCERNASLNHAVRK